MSTKVRSPKWLALPEEAERLGRKLSTCLMALTTTRNSTFLHRAGRAKSLTMTTMTGLHLIPTMNLPQTMMTYLRMKTNHRQTRATTMLALLIPLASLVLQNLPSPTKVKVQAKEGRLGVVLVVPLQVVEVVKEGNHKSKEITRPLPQGDLGSELRPKKTHRLVSHNLLQGANPSRRKELSLLVPITRRPYPRPQGVLLLRVEVRLPLHLPDHLVVPHLQVRRLLLVSVSQYLPQLREHGELHQRGVLQQLQLDLLPCTTKVLHPRRKCVLFTGTSSRLRVKRPSGTVSTTGTLIVDTTMKNSKTCSPRKKSRRKKRRRLSLRSNSWMPKSSKTFPSCCIKCPRFHKSSVRSLIWTIP
eukprot:PhF_6_TR16999/c0_g2_i1/m.25734